MTLTSPDTPLCFTIQMHPIWVILEELAIVSNVFTKERQNGGEMWELELTEEMCKLLRWSDSIPQS